MYDELLGLRGPISCDEQHDAEVASEVCQGEHSRVGYEWLISQEAIGITSNLADHLVAK